METLLTPELKAWIGREVVYEAPDEIGRAAIRYFAMALGDRNPLYWDEDFASKTRHGGIIAPPTFVCETCQYSTLDMDEYGYIGHQWKLPLPNTRLIRAGNDYEFFRPLRPSHRLTVRWRIEDMYERDTRVGRVLVVISEARYWNQDGELLAVHHETMMHQPLEEARSR